MQLGSSNPVSEGDVSPRSNGNGSDQGAFNLVSDAEFASYVFDHANVFARNAEGRELKFLNYLLEMVSIEAARIVDQTASNS